MQLKMARARARAPLRLGFAGGGTDVSPFCDEHGGLVMNATIGLYATAHIVPRDDDMVSFAATDIEESFEGPALASFPLEGPALLHKGVYNRIVRQFNGGRPLPMSLMTDVEVPAGSGLGSSSTLVVALIEAFNSSLGLALGEYDVARLAFEIERLELKLSGGRQDHYAAAFGGFNFMEFGTDDSVIVNPLRVNRAIEQELESAIVLCYSGQSRSSAAIIDTQVKNMTAVKGRSLDGMFALKREASEMKTAILRGDFPAIAETLTRGWAAKQSTAEGISTSIIDRLITETMPLGTLAGKVSGAGGGGFVMLVCDPLRRHKVVRHVAQLGATIMPCRFTAKGAESWRW